MAEYDAPAPADRLQRIAHYRIIKWVGSGATGNVYAAFDERNARQVAVKVLIADLESDPNVRARFYRDAEAAAQVLHRNVVTVYDVGEDQGRSYIVMQLLEGAPLSAFLARPEGVSLEQKLDLMIQVCEGLVAVHARRIVHRDLKPRNLFVQSDGLLTILDFGVAHLAESSMTMAGDMLGTLEYMSPEQSRGEPVDPRSDIFSAGGVFYFMLANRKPFPGSDFPKLLHQISDEEPAPLRGIPSELAAIVMQALAKRAEHRPARVEQLLADLVRFQRQYQADTRRLGFALRTQFEEIHGLVTSLRQTVVSLGLPDNESDELEAIRREYPFLAARVANERIQFERGVLDTIAQRLRERREVLVARLETRYALLRFLQDGEKLLAAGDAVAAREAFERVLAECPGAVRAAALLNIAGPLAQEQRQRVELLKGLHARIRSALAADDLAMAQAYCEQAWSVDASNATTTALAADVDDAVATQRERIASEVQSRFARAEDAMDRDAFDEASEALDEVARLHPDAPGLDDAWERLVQRRTDAEAVALLLQMSGEAVRRARAAFRRGQRDSAVHELESFLTQQPGAIGVAEELDHLRSLQSSIADWSANADRQVRDLLTRAANARDREAFTDAVTALQEALRLDPASTAAAEMLSDVLERHLESRIAQERLRVREQRWKATAGILTAASAARAQGYVAAALQAAKAAQQISPDAIEVAPFIDEAQHELSAEDVETFPLEGIPFRPAPKNGGSNNGRLWWTDLVTGLRRRKT